LNKYVVFLISSISALLHAQKKHSYDLLNKHAVIFTDSGKTGLMHGKKTLIPAVYDSIKPIKKNFAMVAQKGQLGVYENGVGEIVPCQYEHIQLVNDTLLIVGKSQMYGVLNLRNDTKLGLSHKNITINNYGNSIIENYPELILHQNGTKQTYLADSLIEDENELLLWRNGLVVERTKIKFDLAKSVEYPTYTDNRNGTERYFDRNFQTLYPKSYNQLFCDSIFKQLFSEIRFWNDSLIVYKSGQKFGLGNISPNLLTAADFDSIAPICKNTLIFSKNGKWGLMNREGQQITDTLYDCLQTIPSHQYCKVSIADSQGLIGYNGLTIISPKYDFLKMESSENILKFSNVGKYLAIVDTSGRQLLDTNYHYEEIGAFRYGFAKVKKNGKFGFINKRGGLTIANQYLQVGDAVKEERAAVLIKGKWALVDSWEKMLAQPYYDHIGLYQDSVAVAQKNGKYLLLDYNGKELCSNKFEAISKFNSYAYIVKQGGKFGVMLKNGNEVVFTKYDKILDIKNNFIVIGDFGKTGLLDQTGKTWESLEYDNVILLNNAKGYILIKNIARSILKF
jgi:hypothetical protein